MKLTEKAQSALNAVIRSFESGDLSPIVHIVRLHRTGDPIPADRWSLSNQVLAYIQTGSLDCRGFNQWKQAGRHVTAGSHAAYILGPVTCYTKDKDTGEEVTILRGFAPIAVFPDTATDGQPLPAAQYTPAELPPLADVAARLGIAVTWTPTPPGQLGSCSIDGNRITLGAHDTAVFFHELAHAAHARIDGLRGGQQPGQETIAEFTAAVLMQLYGLSDRTGNAWTYIARYNADPLLAIVKAMATVEKVLDLLLN